MKNFKLSSINKGSAESLFQAELEKVLENIADPNTKAEAPREITIKVGFVPNSNRNGLNVKISSSSKLAKIKSVSSIAYINEEGISEVDPGQEKIDFDQTKIHSITADEEA